MLHGGNTGYSSLSGKRGGGEGGRVKHNKSGVPVVGGLDPGSRGVTLGRSMSTEDRRTRGKGERGKGGGTPLQKSKSAASLIKTRTAMQL